MTPLWIPFVTVPLLCSMHRPRARPEVFAKNPSLLEPEDSGKNLSLLDRTSTPVAPMTNPESTHHESPGTESTLHQRVATISNRTHEVVATDVDGESVEKQIEDVNVQIRSLIDGIQKVSNELMFRMDDPYSKEEEKDRSSQRKDRVDEMVEFLEATRDETRDETRNEFEISENFLKNFLDFEVKERKLDPNVPERGPKDTSLFKLNAKVQFCAKVLEELKVSMEEEREEERLRLQLAIKLTQDAVNLASMQ